MNKLLFFYAILILMNTRSPKRIQHNMSTNHNECQLLSKYWTLNTRSLQSCDNNHYEIINNIRLCKFSIVNINESNGLRITNGYRTLLYSVFGLMSKIMVSIHIFTCLLSILQCSSISFNICSIVLGFRSIIDRAKTVNLCGSICLLICHSLIINNQKSPGR